VFYKQRKEKQRLRKNDFSTTHLLLYRVRSHFKAEKRKNKQAVEVESWTDKQKKEGAVL